MARPRPKKAAAPQPPPPRPPLTPSPTKQFERDVDLMQRRGKDMEKLKGVIVALCSRGPLAPELRDHPLRGEWNDWRDCHVEGDWLVIYRKTPAELLLARTGTHSDLFE